MVKKNTCRSVNTMMSYTLTTHCMGTSFNVLYHLYGPIHNYPDNSAKRPIHQNLQRHYISKGFLTRNVMNMYELLHMHNNSILPVYGLVTQR